MRTDEHVDRWLREAGARWRAATDTAPQPVSPRTAPPRRWPRALAVAAVVAALAGGVGWFAVDRAANDRPTATQGTMMRPSSGPPVPLMGPKWTLVRWVLAGGTAMPAVRQAYLLVDHTNIGGSDGCNYFGGPVRVQGSEMMIGQVSSTLMGCSGELGAQTGAESAVLQGTVHFAIAGDELTIEKRGVGSLTFRRTVVPVPPTDPAALASNRWALSGIEQDTGSNGTASGSAGYAEAVLRFIGAAHAIVDNRCGAGEVSASVTTGRLVLDTSPVAALPDCPASALTPAEWTTVGRVLTGSVTWAITGNTLRIIKAGVGALTFTRL